MKISVTIMAHPTRRAAAEKLLVQLAGTGFVMGYITWDQKNNEWDTGSRALARGIELNADYHVVLQDDAILAPNFYQNVAAALSAVPKRSLVSLYTGTGRPLPDRVSTAVERAPNGSWLQFQTLLWGVGIAVPTGHLIDLLEFVADSTHVYDTRIGWAYMRQALPVYYTNPSLVDHDDDMGSLLKESVLVPASDYEKTPRRAHNFIGDRAIAWTSQTTDI
jgi:hypothetical protein